MLEQCCNYPKQCRNNVGTLSCAISRCCEPSRVTSPFKKLVNDSLLQATATKNRGPKSVFAYRRFQSALKFHEGCIISRRSSILCEFPERIVSFSLSKVVSKNYYWYSIKKIGARNLIVFESQLKTAILEGYTKKCSSAMWTCILRSVVKNMRTIQISTYRTKSKIQHNDWTQFMNQ